VKPILVVPSYEKGRGGGHRARCAALVQEMRSMGREVFLYTPDDFFPPAPGFFDFIVLDCFRTSEEDFLKWRKLAPLVGIDEGGLWRKKFDFLIDILPNLENSPPNILNPALITPPKTRRDVWFKEKEGKTKVLVSFGAEDAAGLTVPAVENLLADENIAVTALFGALNQTPESQKANLQALGAEILEKTSDLRDHLAEYDLVITHFGLTAFECLCARVPAALASPTPYHEKLAQNAGFFSLKKWEKERKIDSGFLNDISILCKKISEKYGLENAESPARLLSRIEMHRACICGEAEPSNALARFIDRTYFRCPECQINYLVRSSPPPIEYAKDYFFDFYQKQYGKTYLEDFPNLINAGKKRIFFIKKFLKNEKKKKKEKILDIGCAYGAFLLAAKEEGFDPSGHEAAEDAADYVKNALKIPCVHGFFPADTEMFSDGQFSVISLWYVIEHFENTGAALLEINRLLERGGVFAFSTPSFSGVSARKSPKAGKNFLEKSPPDHYTLWKPAKTRAVLKRFGFVLKKTVITGHHPERFPVIGKWVFDKNGGKRAPLYAALLGISRLFRLGDTFEAYAVKK
jgi:2-polyprenyl-3-methyl-5-hydroxy-6-metoxy-1,4-benzoquinol methylase/spore coat polysaccharide biosynthesis predicted glycosyltransferase SpsG